MGKLRDAKVAILSSTTRKGTTLNTSAVDSPSVISQLVSPPQASRVGTSAESENSSYNFDDASTVLDDNGSLGPFLDATIARSRQIENTKIPNENTVTPVNSPESIEHSSDNPDRDYVELDDDFIDKCNATTSSRAYLDSCAGCVFRKRTPDEAEELLARISQNHDDWTTFEPTPTPILKKRGMIELNDEDIREAKKSLKEKGTAKNIENRPKALMELYREVTNDDDRTIQHSKIRNIQLPVIRYFTYNLATSILGRENTSNISSYHLAFLVAALTGSTPYHLGALIARRLSNKGPIYGGIVASRIVAYLGLSVDPSDEKLTPIKIDIAAMKGHQFVTTNSNLENIVYRMLFIDGDEREIPSPQADLFSVRRRPWSRSKEEVDEQLRILGFHQQHDSEDAEPSDGYTVTYPGASSSLYQGQDPPSSYYGGATSWAPWD
ncbi:hypothetical protein QYE76_062638 [Lolium multiflorum]|uniref:Arabidopsis retrotransposon Orf1 C-terminal domain-containing protein n=1 Tax=Lolium multiflorum TaxID=4521 RepID=A0AAD8S4V4_LOLMU|nr:hypothetical protein QYE76_062638 [Lolium multiflorum]